MRARAAHLLLLVLLVLASAGATSIVYNVSPLCNVDESFNPVIANMSSCDPLLSFDGTYGRFDAEEGSISFQINCTSCNGTEPTDCEAIGSVAPGECVTGNASVDFQLWTFDEKHKFSFRAYDDAECTVKSKDFPGSASSKNGLCLRAYVADPTPLLQFILTDQGYLFYGVNCEVGPQQQCYNCENTTIIPGGVPETGVCVPLGPIYVLLKNEGTLSTAAPLLLLLLLVATLQMLF